MIANCMLGCSDDNDFSLALGKFYELHILVFS